MKKLILIGGGGHCKSCIDVIESTEKYEIMGVLDISEKVGQLILNYKIIGTDDNISTWINDEVTFLITVGQIKNSSLRKKIFENLTNNNAKMSTVFSKYAVVSNYSKIGQGTIVMHHAVINADVTIGENAIINTKALIEHDSRIGNQCHVSTGAIINGGCTVGNHVFIGSQAVIAQGINICDNVVIGAGAVVVKPIDTEGLYIGNPARKL
jgi:sugar O-acyltransferase (sialic acid O-acetyltransferase NeuD family)